MSRIRYNNAVGTLGVALTSSGTTITFATAPAFSTLASGDYIPLVIDPSAGSTPNSAFEIVWLTAYTASATTGTIQRGMEGTTAVAHVSGAQWVSAATALEVQSLQTPVAARAYLTANVGSFSNAVVPFNAVLYDTGSNFDTTNHWFKCPVAGYYQVNATVNITSWQATGLIEIYVNGGGISRGGQTQVSMYALTVSDVVKCNAGDQITIGAYQGGGSGTLDASDQTWMSVALLAPVLPASQVTNVARAYRNAAFTSISGWTKVPIDTTTYDPQGSMDVVTNHRYNVPVAGYYQVNAQAHSDSNTDVGIYKNGTRIAQGGSTSAAAQATVSEILQCSAGDYLELWVFGGTTLTTSDSAQNFLSVAQLAVPTNLGNANALPAGAAYQNGVINSGDLAISAISINTSTGALTFTLASAQPCVVKDTTGALIPVTYMGVTGAVLTPSLPASTKYAVIGVEIDTNGLITLVKGTDTSTQPNTGSLIASNTPATTSGRMRIADFAYWNNAGTINFSDHTTTATQGTNWIDRRPWARGAYKLGSSSSDISKTSTSQGAIDATNLQFRVESTGAPMRARINGEILSAGGSTSGVQFEIAIDGTAGLTTERVFFVPGASTRTGFAYEIILSLAAGSHLLAASYASWDGSNVTLKGAVTPTNFEIEEVLKANSSNGTA